MNDQDRKLTQLYRQGAGTNNPDCPDSSMLARLADGRIWPWQRRRLVAHLGRCTACADDYQVVSRARAGLTDALAGFETPTTSLRPALIGLATAGLVALAVVLVAPPERPVFDHGMASHSGSVERADPSPEADVLFSSNFDHAPAESRALFRDDFDG